MRGRPEELTELVVAKLARRVRHNLTERGGVETGFNILRKAFRASNPPFIVPRFAYHAFQRVGHSRLPIRHLGAFLPPLELARLGAMGALNLVASGYAGLHQTNLGLIGQLLRTAQREEWHPKMRISHHMARMHRPARFAVPAPPMPRSAKFVIEKPRARVRMQIERRRRGH